VNEDLQVIGVTGTQNEVRTDRTRWTQLVAQYSIQEGQEDQIINLRNSYIRYTNLRQCLYKYLPVCDFFGTEVFVR